MSDLQDALDLHDEWMTGVSWNPHDPHSQAILVIVEAVRAYANPDMEAFHKALYEWYHSERPMSSDVEQELVDAALGVTEDE